MDAPPTGPSRSPTTGRPDGPEDPADSKPVSPDDFNLSRSSPPWDRFQTPPYPRSPAPPVRREALGWKSFVAAAAAAAAIIGYFLPHLETEVPAQKSVTAPRPRVPILPEARCEAGMMSETGDLLLDPGLDAYVLPAGKPVVFTYACENDGFVHLAIESEASNRMFLNLRAARTAEQLPLTQSNGRTVSFEPLPGDGSGSLLWMFTAEALPEGTVIPSAEDVEALPVTLGTREVRWLSKAGFIVH